MSNQERPNANRERKDSASVAKNSLLVETGLTIVASDSVEALVDARCFLTDQICHGKADTGLQYPPIGTLTALHSGTERILNFAAKTIKSVESAPYKAIHQIVPVSPYFGFNFCGIEGRTKVLQFASIRSKPDRPNGITFLQDIKSPEDALLNDALFQIRVAAKEAGVIVIAMLACENGFEESQLQQLCDEFIQIEECEPDFDQDSAFSVECYSLRQLRRFGVGKIMCSMRFEEDGIRQTLERFISKEVHDRVMWHLRSSGKTYAEIGLRFGVDKTTAMRQLQKMPRTIPKELDSDRIEQLLEHMEYDGGKKPTKSFDDLMEERNSSRNQDSVDYDDGDDDDDEPVRKPRATRATSAPHS